jgi:hypothetical protein
VALVGVTLTLTTVGVPDGDTLGLLGVVAVAVLDRTDAPPTPPQPKFAKAEPIRRVKKAMFHSSLFTYEPFRLNRGTGGVAVETNKPF